MSNRLAISGGSLRRWKGLALFVAGLLGCGSASDRHSGAGGASSSGATGGGGADSSTIGTTDGSASNTDDAGAAGSSGATEESGPAGSSSDGGSTESGVAEGGSVDVADPHVCGDDGAPSFPPATGTLID